MNRTLIAIAAGALAAALAPAAQAGFVVPSVNATPLVLKAECAEDYAEYLEERAEERAEAIEDGEVYAPRQASTQSRAEVQRASTEPQQAATPKATADASDKKHAKADVKSETKDAKSETKKSDEPKKTDSKSFASAGGSCKKYFSSVGMTLSVPCE